MLAEAGIASRRAAEQFIASGRVSVNGEVVLQLGTKVSPDRDRVKVDGRPVKTRKKLYLAVHKPRGVVCTRSDPRNRTTIGQLLPLEWDHLYPVGRLDFESEGLIFMTNDGDFSLRVTHPRYQITKTYEAFVRGKVTHAQLNAFTRGIVDKGERLQASKARILSSSPHGSLVQLELTEGKNREIRRMFESQGFTVNQLVRTRIGPIPLGELPSGRWRTLTESEINSLLPSL